MKKAKEIDDVINEMTRKYHFKGNEKLVKNWYYKDGEAFWTDVRIAVKVSGLCKEAEGIADKLYLSDIPLRKKTEYDMECPAYSKIFPSSLDDKKEIEIVKLADDLPIKNKYLQFGGGCMVYMGENNSNAMIMKSNSDISVKMNCWHYKLVQDLNERCINGNLFFENPNKPLYYRGEYADKLIEIVFAPVAIDCDFELPKWENTAREEKEMQEIQEEIQHNEEPQEELNDVEELEDEKYDCNDEKMSEIDKDEPLEEEKEENNIDNISEVKQELTDDMTIYDIVFEYLIKNSCIPTSNGSGGLNIDCPYQKKDIVKSLGAMWSPRYYRWYLRADRLEKAANIIKKLA